MLKKQYKNSLTLRGTADPKERRENMYKEVMKNSSFLPQSLTYEHIDQAMLNWSENELGISFEGKKLPTIALFTNQRFEEYMQNWEHTDEKMNPLLNFKTITREINPKSGSINGENTKNIPGDRFYTMKRERVIDKNGQVSFMEWKMKQPIAVDLSYRITLVTGKIELMNTFNILVLDIFKSGYSYLNVNGHYIYIKLESIEDESEKGLDTRRYMSQSLKLLVKAYIIQNEDLKVEETPIIKFNFNEGIENTNSSIEEDYENAVFDNNTYYEPLSVKIAFETLGENELKTKIPYNMNVKKINKTNIEKISIYIDSELIDTDNDFIIPEYTTIKIEIKKINALENGYAILEGYNIDKILTDEELVIS